MDMRRGKDAFEKGVLRKNEITSADLLLAVRRTWINLPPQDTGYNLKR